jgi:hypothetical protein
MPDIFESIIDKRLNRHADKVIISDGIENHRQQVLRLGLGRTAIYRDIIDDIPDSEIYIHTHRLGHHSRPYSTHYILVDSELMFVPSSPYEDNRYANTIQSLATLLKITLGKKQ